MSKFIHYKNEKLFSKVLENFNVEKEIIDRLEKYNAFLAGGAILAEVFGIGKINDYDFYFENDYSYEKVKVYLERKYYPPKRRIGDINSTPTYDINLKRVQLVNFVFGKSEEILNTFDITACKVGLSFGDRTFVVNTDAINDIKNKIIHFNNHQKPYNNLLRAVKYVVSKEFKIPKSELLIIKLMLSNKQEVDEKEYDTNILFNKYYSYVCKLFNDQPGKVFWSDVLPTHEEIIKKLLESCVDE